MREQAVFAQMVVGYSPLVNAKREVIGQHLTLFPSRAEAPVDVAALMSVLEEVCPARSALSPGMAPVTTVLNPTSEAWIDALLGSRLPPHLGLSVPAFLAEEAARSQAIQGFAAQGGSLVLSGRMAGEVAPELKGLFRLALVDAQDDELGLLREPTAGPRPLPTLFDRVPSQSEALRALEQADVLGLVGWPPSDGLDAVPVAPKSSKGVNPSIKTIIDLMNMVEREESVDHMERTLKGDPALALKLLQLINSPAFGLRVEVTSFRHAMMLLGHNRLKRWLALLLASSLGSEGAAPLLYLSVRRGFLMEELAQAAGQEDLRGEMFICGMFSVLDRLMSQSFAELLEFVPMPARVQVSLLGNGGPYEGHLRLLDAIETASLMDLRESSEKLLLSAGDLSRATLTALALAQELSI